MKYLTLVLILISFGSIAKDNDDLAFEFINSEPEIVYVARECLENEEITSDVYYKALDENMAETVLDPRKYCLHLVEIINGVEQ